MKDGGWRLLRRELGRRRTSLVRMGGWSAVEALPALTGGLLVAAAVDRGFLAGRPWHGLAWLAGFALCAGLRLFASQRLVTHLADVVEPVRDALADAVVAGALRRSVREGSRPDVPAITRLTTQVQSIRGLLSALLTDVRDVAICAVAAIIGLAVLHPVLALAALTPVLIGSIAFVRLQRTMRERRLAVLLAEESIASEAIAGIDGIRDIVACRAQQATAARIGAAIEAERTATGRVARGEISRLLVLSVTAELPLLAVLALAPALIASGDLTAGQLLGAVVYLSTALRPAVSTLLGSLSLYGLQLGVTLDRIAATTVEPAPVSRGPAPHGHLLEIRDLTFGYAPESAPVIGDLDLVVAEGEHVAVVGPSGAGKSTLAHLMSGLLAPTAGSVRIGGVEVPELGDRAGTVMLLPQQAYVFCGTLRENLTYLNDAASNDDLDRACDAIGLHDLLARVGGYDDLVGTGEVELSEADKQLIALVRVYLSPAPVVILDEATCFLDPAGEDRAERAFHDRGGTLIVVAHRMSSALRAERVLVVDGDGIRAGTHPELMSGCARYRDLVGHWSGTTNVPVSAAQLSKRSTMQVS